MQLNLISQRCIACGLCFREHPEIFTVDDKGIAHFKKELTTKDYLTLNSSQIKQLRTTITNCPGHAFYISH
ncbi:MAG: ferredoxin [Lactobacillaceae bacterium]